MARTVVAHENDVVVVIHGIVFREGTACPESVHDLHRLYVLDFVFSGDGDSASRKQTGTQNDGAYDVFILGIACAFVIVGQRAETMALDEDVQSYRSPGCTYQFIRRAVVLDLEGGPEFKIGRASCRERV